MVERHEIYWLKSSDLARLNVLSEPVTHFEIEKKELEKKVDMVHQNINPSDCYY